MTDKNIIHNAKENININSDKEVIINVGSSTVMIDKYGCIQITGTKIKIKSLKNELEIE